MRRKEERSKQGQTNNKAKQHSTPKAVIFTKKNELPRVEHVEYCDKNMVSKILYTISMYVIMAAIVVIL